MKDRYFLDTNILVYALLGEDEKSERALELLDGATVSVQVLNELANVARKKAKMGWGEIQQLTGAVAELAAVEPLTPEIHTAGLGIASRYGLSLYDSMVVASAVGARCKTLYTEDMQHGQQLGSVKLINPFKA